MTQRACVPDEKSPRQNDACATRWKVLIQAYACSPYRGSEAGIGWGWAEAISRHHDVWVITAQHYRDEIENELRLRPCLRSRMTFHYIKRKRWQLVEAFWPPAYLWTYKYQWQRRALRIALRLHRDVGFDMTHQLTYEGFRVPGYLWRLPVPFVWGPIGGLEQTTWSLLPALGIGGLIHFAGRNVLNQLHKRFLREPRIAFQRARGGVIAATDEIRRQILQYYGVDSEVMCEIGLPPVVASAPLARQAGEPVRITWSGLHIPRKALPFLLRALSAVPANIPWELSILGAGPCNGKWQRLAKRLHLQDRCTWHGSLPRDAALAVMRRSHMFCITSVYDLTSTVLIEALALGLPVICPDHCGFRDVVNETCGIKVNADSPRGLVQGLVAAIGVLANDEPRRLKLAEGAIARAREFAWERKAELVDRIYRRKMNMGVRQCLS